MKAKRGKLRGRGCKEGMGEKRKKTKQILFEKVIMPSI